MKIDVNDPKNAIFVGTGIFMSDEHRLMAIKRAKIVADTPIVKVDGVWLPDKARRDFGEWIDRLAESYGLPPPEMGSDDEAMHYSMNFDGEFTTRSKN